MLVQGWDGDESDQIQPLDYMNSQPTLWSPIVAIFIRSGWLE